MTDERSDLLTVREVARELRVSEPTAYRRIHDGQLPAVRVGEDGPLRVRRDALDGLLRPTQPTKVANDARQHD